MMALTQVVSTSIFSLLVISVIAKSRIRLDVSDTPHAPKFSTSENLASKVIPPILKAFHPMSSRSEVPYPDISQSPHITFDLQSDGVPAAPRELINLGSPSSGISPCATVLTTSNCVLQIPDDSIHKDLQARQFTFAAGLIKDQCSLTIQDCSGSYSTFTNYLFPPGGICTVAASVCCECNGCNRPSLPLYKETCASLFENEKCSHCNGFRLEVVIGDEIAMLNPFVDDRVSSIYVAPGCELKIYQDPNFQGYAAVAQGSLDFLPYEWNDQISSFKCDCANTPASTTAPFPVTTLLPISPSPDTTTDKPLVSTTPEKLLFPSTERLPTTSKPETTTHVLIPTTTFISETKTTTSHSYESTTDILRVTTEKEPETTSDDGVESTTDYEVEPTTKFDDSNSVY